MLKVNFISHDGQRIETSADSGMTVMQVAQAAGVDGIVAECGGAAACATCHVYVGDGFSSRLPPIGTQEEQMLEFVASQRRANSRLSCQITLTSELDGLTVQLPEHQF